MSTTSESGLDGEPSRRTATAVHRSWWPNRSPAQGYVSAQCPARTRRASTTSTWSVNITGARSTPAASWAPLSSIGAACHTCGSCTIWSAKKRYLDAVAGLRAPDREAATAPRPIGPGMATIATEKIPAGVVDHAVHTQLVVRPVEAHHPPTVQQRAVLFVPVDPLLQHRQFLGAGLGDVPFDPQVPEDGGGSTSAARGCVRWCGTGPRRYASRPVRVG